MGNTNLVRSCRLRLSSPESNATNETRRLDRQLRNASIAESTTSKLLLLGASQSGKSTLFKQWRMVYGKAYRTEEERIVFKNPIHENLIRGMQTLIEARLELSGAQKIVQLQTALTSAVEQPVQEIVELIVSFLHQFDIDFKLSKAGSAACNVLAELSPDAVVTPEVAAFIKTAWNDEGLQTTWLNSRFLRIKKGLNYFMEHLDRVSEADYIPTKKDVIHYYRPTTGVVEENFRFKKRPFKIIDVEALRNSEVPKWLSLFSNVTGVVFVASLAGFDEMCHEDPTMLRMRESLIVFQEVLQYFEHNAEDKRAGPSIILFLNDSDVFREKIARGASITTCFPDYSGDNTDADSFNYIKDVFLSYRGRIQIFAHRTTATDTKAMRHIFNDVNSIIIGRALCKAGLLTQ